MGQCAQGSPEGSLRLMLAVGGQHGRRLRRDLRQLHATVATANRVADVVDQAGGEAFDGLLLDAEFGGGLSAEICAYIARQTDTAVIFISDSESDRVAALLQGADDSVALDCPAGEMLARTAAVRRRIVRTHERRNLLNAVQFGFEGYDYCHRRRRLVRPDASVVALSAGVANTLMAFLLQPGRWLSCDHIRSVIRPDHVASDNELRVGVHRLRKALGQPGEALIKNRARYGYRLVARVSSPGADGIWRPALS